MRKKGWMREEHGGSTTGFFRSLAKKEIQVQTQRTWNFSCRYKQIYKIKLQNALKVWGSVWDSKRGKIRYWLKYSEVWKQWMANKGRPHLRWQPGHSQGDTSVAVERSGNAGRLRKEVPEYWKRSCGTSRPPIGRAWCLCCFLPCASAVVASSCSSLGEQSSQLES